MSHVANFNEIERNAFALLDVAHGMGAERDLALKLIKGSFVYYPVEYEGQLAFVPSKFIGYRNNTVAKHEALKRVEGRDGRQTNVAVDKILGRSFADDKLDERLREYCRFLGVEVEKKKHRFWRVDAAKRFTARNESAINDIQQSENANSDPEYKRRMAGSYLRDPKVRSRVLKRSDGKCEFGSARAKRGGCLIFSKPDGTPYLETHHVIKLSEQGRDTDRNVIALCPHHHREAHFGKRWKELQDEFLEILSVKVSP